MTDAPAPTDAAPPAPHWVMIMRDTSYMLVGPFDTNDQAADWGRAHAYAPGDDPRWQTLQLADPRQVTVVTPAEAAVP